MLMLHGALWKKHPYMGQWQRLSQVTEGRMEEWICAAAASAALLRLQILHRSTGSCRWPEKEDEPQQIWVFLNVALQKKGRVLFLTSARVWWQCFKRLVWDLKGVCRPDSMSSLAAALIPSYVSQPASVVLTSQRSTKLDFQGCQSTSHHHH